MLNRAIGLIHSIPKKTEVSSVDANGSGEKGSTGSESSTDEKSDSDGQVVNTAKEKTTSEEYGQGGV